MSTPKSSCGILLASVGGLLTGASLSAKPPADEEKFGAVVIHNRIDRAGATKKHRLGMSVNRVYQITVEPENKSATVSVRVLNDKGAVLAQANGTGKTVVDCSPNADALYNVVVSASAVRALGRYSLSVGISTGFSTKIFTDQLTRNDPFDKVRRGCRCKVHPLRLRAGQAYVIDMEARWDTYIRVEDSIGRNLAMNDDGGVGLNSRLTFRPTRTDKYRIVATSFSSSGIGPYKLTVRRLGAGRPILAVKGKLARTDAKDNVLRTSYSKRYAVNLTAGRVYSISMTSAQMNAFLRLERAGRALFADDNGDGGTNAQMTYRPTVTGVYRIIATTSAAGQTGDFALTVREN